MRHDVFISHASSDKDAFVRPIAEAFDAAGISYWLDELQIGWGDSIALKINDGLKTSRFCLLCLSPSFCDRPWPEMELSSALSVQNTSGIKRVLPLVLDSKDEVMAQYPILAGFAYQTYNGDPTAIASSLSTVLAAPPKSGHYEIRIHAINSGTVEHLIVPDLASIKWVTKLATSAFGLRNEADTGGFSRFHIRWVLIHDQALQEWQSLPRFEQREIYALTKTVEHGLKSAYHDLMPLSELGATNGCIFHLCAIEDEEFSTLIESHV